MKIYIMMDEGFIWYPVVGDTKPSMEIPVELFDEYMDASAKWRNIQDKLEQLYRVQRGLAPWETPPVPHHLKFD